MTGLAKSLIRLIGLERRRAGIPPRKSAAESCVWVLGFLRSAPALNAPPASSPVRTTQRISGSSSSTGSSSWKPALNSGHHALRASGRLSVRTAMAPRLSQSSGIRFSRCARSGHGDAVLVLPWIAARLLVPRPREAPARHHVVGEHVLLSWPLLARQFVGHFEPVAVGVAEVDTQRDAVIDDALN